MSSENNPYATPGSGYAVNVGAPAQNASPRQQGTAPERLAAGGTDPVEKATPGTIRGDFGLETQSNLVHGSDSPESAAREIALWFPALSN